MAHWRPLLLSDIPDVARVADVVHPDLPEDDAVFAERVRLFPEGCLALIDEAGALCGYTISHPVRRRQTPPVNTLLGAIPADADQYYLHDVCMLPAQRGRGLVAPAITRLLAVAERYPSACLVSVYGTARFWGRHGFVAPVEPDGEDDDAFLAKLRSYGDDAIYLERPRPSQ